MKHKKKQSWHHTPSKAHSELARERHSYKQQSRQEEDTSGTLLWLPSEEGLATPAIGDSYFNRVEHETNSTNFSTVNPWATLDHTHTMGQGGESLEEHYNVGGIGATHRGETVSSDFETTDIMGYEQRKNQNRHDHAKTSDSPDHPQTMRQGGTSIEERDNARGFGETRREKTENLDFRHSIKNT